jgi:hypothetical protein
MLRATQVLRRQKRKENPPATDPQPCPDRSTPVQRQPATWKINRVQHLDVVSRSVSQSAVGSRQSQSTVTVVSRASRPTRTVDSDCRLGLSTRTND